MIEWADFTLNPWIGCTKVSPGCDRCYAERLSGRFGVQWGPHGERKRTSLRTWHNPFVWARGCRRRGDRKRVFCASLADVFDNQVPVEWRRDLLTLIDATPELDWLLLTKRPENVKKLLAQAAGVAYQLPAHVWLGTTTENQDRFDHRWPILADIPAAVRFISAEPLLEPLTIGHWEKHARPDWVICGGESGYNARFMPPAWAAALRDECAERQIAFFLKQMSSKSPIPDDLNVRQFPKGNGK